MNVKRIISAAALASALIAVSAFGQGAGAGPDARVGEDAVSVIRAIDDKQRSATSRQDMTMITYPDMADESKKREFSIRSYSKGDDDGYMEFVEPKSIKGLRILSKGDDNWVFFPSTGRTRKIAGKSKKDSVQGVGGDFSYEDVGGGSFESKYDFKIVKSDSSSWNLEGIAKNKDGVYSRIVIVADKARKLPTKIEFYTEEDGHFKDLSMSDFKVLGGRDTATRMTMINLKKKSKTVVAIKAAEYDIQIDEKYFNPSRFDK
jgi:hypothetical protein